MNRRVFFASVRKSFGRLKQGQVDGLNKILDYWEAKWPHMIVEELADVLATTKWETGHTFQPIEEGYPLKGAKLRAYQQGLRYYPAYGRGLVQTTWPKNYARLGLNTPADYPKALEWDYALRFLFEGMVFGWYTGKKLSDYISAVHQDYVGARAIVNGEDHAQDIAGYAVKFLASLRAAMAAAPEPEKPAASTGAKIGASIAGTGAAAAGANIAMGGDETTSAVVAALSALAGLVSWLAPKVKNTIALKPEMPAPKPPPIEQSTDILVPMEITHSETAAFDAADANCIALEKQLELAYAAREVERKKVEDRAAALLAAIGQKPKDDQTIAISAATASIEGSPQ